MKKYSKISKGTIVRTIMVAIVMVNLILNATENNLIEIEEGTVHSIVETIIEISVIAVAWWKNNSVSENAIMADDFLSQLKED